MRKTDTCWLWTGATVKGYGVFKCDGRMVYAHRWSWEDSHGPIPDGLTIDHLCRTHNCVKPPHLEPVTCQENILRGNGLAANNARKEECPQGHSYSGDNLRVTGDGARRCRKCDRVRERERYRKLHNVTPAKQRGSYKEKAIAT